MTNRDQNLTAVNKRLYHAAYRLAGGDGGDIIGKRATGGGYGDETGKALADTATAADNLTQLVSPCYRPAANDLAGWLRNAERANKANHRQTYTTALARAAVAANALAVGIGDADKGSDEYAEVSTLLIAAATTAINL